MFIVYDTNVDHLTTSVIHACHLEKIYLLWRVEKSKLRLLLYITIICICATANVGGTLGLCIGMSILTVCELIEFVILQIYRLLNSKLSGSTRVQNVTLAEQTTTNTVSTVRVIDLDWTIRKINISIRFAVQ